MGVLSLTDAASADKSVIVTSGLCGLASIFIVAAVLVRPAGALAEATHRHRTGLDARDQLLRLCDRRDEFGAIAADFVQQESSFRAKLHEAHERERDMRSSATQFSAMLQSMVDGVIAVDSQERILFANHVFCEMFDLDASKIAGRPVFEAVRNTHFQEVAHEAVAHRQQQSIEFRLVNKKMQVSMSAAPISGSGAVLVLNDVSEVRRLESMRRDFVSSVSHELKTPLTVIQACTETLLDGAVDDGDNARRFLHQIEEQSERLLQLIIRMLHLARVESGELVLSQTAVDLAQVSADVAASMTHVARGKGIELNVDGLSELFVLADDQAVRTIVSNLVDNAIIYTPEGGRIKITLRADDDAAVLSVTDTGIGISEANQERIFERFYRVDRDRNRERGGTGLGLAIVKHLCQAMHAEISLKSTLGQGSVISVKFPFHD